MSILSIPEKIRQRRAQMLIHSYLYYVADDPIVSDDDWQKWANDLTDLQKKYPRESKIGFFDGEFSDWTGDTGMHLPLKHPWVISKATYIHSLFKEN